MRVFLNIVKHALLFFLANCLAVILLLFIMWIFKDGSSAITNGNNHKLLSFVAVMGSYGMLFTFIPYAIALPIIKSSKNLSIGYYALGGAAAPLLLCVLLISLGFPIASIVVAGVGAICGLLYGYLDKKIQILPNKKPDAGGAHE